MGKTPGQIKYEASQGIAEFKIPWEKITPYAKEIWELQAAAARPQIEAEARAAEFLEKRDTHLN